MPELPEVESVRRGLVGHVTGRRIADVQVLSDRAVRRHVGGAVDFRAVTAGRRVTGVDRRGKYLWWVLDDGDAILCHLGMSGQFRIGSGQVDLHGGDPAPRHPHLRVRFVFDDDGPDVDFLDQRTFGGMAFAPGGADLPAAIAHIARDPMDPDWSAAATAAVIRGKRTDIKRALLDQTVISGIGNIYADEALWRARLHYARRTDSLTRPAVLAVLAAAREVMAEALEVGGTSFDSLYVNVNGESGYFDRALNAYGREGEPCPRCGTAIVRDAFMNRSSFFCRRCQPAPRRPAAAPVRGPRSPAARRS
ncbi:bifunctional DNA-formamidopyrimidine glycosylase/DNA-(apurinic or apyrimidinic site) lyase [Nakamurella flavida]|uniref:Formamidopyrimidine-DNA glycosylase n=1 Tax=Nakamurella flavida TaxID=363630 RepID=A0A938YKA1_9ACTN|nr:bifunctional DNA-formamidopyrimidine glycosylase/DNA-(apurinic or apyrimidinic site) lyase [Nakamurella flavida]MBM9474859.1 bifunctional DNA-formamidopyrimidine glycosylase/DNA-(apurinic or apyrimidinic site) lyase [Nakamurella flavida]MDP9776429.1 formamidopyrimidine-DNA glycosylase [Nakamurella flavida]